jgi:hypothetical protein
MKVAGTFSMTAKYRLPNERPLMNDRQNGIWRELLALETLCSDLGLAKNSSDACGQVLDACQSLAFAMDQLGLAYDEHGMALPKSPAWAPFSVVEDWCLMTAIGTGSARRLAVVYLACVLRGRVDLGAVSLASIHSAMMRGLDDDRIAMVDAILGATLPDDETPPGFWRIFWRYRGELEREIERHLG